MNRYISIKRLILLFACGLVISCADQKTEAAQNTIESDPVQSEEKDSPNGITTLVVTGNVHGQIDPCG
jgi:hypothetical protein